MSSNISFDRWVPHAEFSMPYSAYNSYNSELRQMYRAMLSSHSYVYTSLKEDRGAKWEDAPSHFFKFDSDVKKTNAFFTDLKEWSRAYNKLQNWNNLNTLLAICANFETYLVGIIKLSLESDVGVLYGMSKELDGIKAIKLGKQFDFTAEIISCTKGDWSSRISHLKQYFGVVPTILETNISQLDIMRRTRNDVAHSFGRNINAAQEIHKLQKVDSISMSNRQVLKYWKLVDNCVREIDNQFFKQHVGEYQLLYFYYLNELTIKSGLSPSQLNASNKARLFRKLYGKAEKNGVTTLPQKFCVGLVEYYDNI